MNFKKNAVPPTKKPLFPGYGNDHMMQPQKKSVSLLTLFVVVFCTFAVALLLFKNFDRITNRFVPSLEQSSTFDIGQNVSLYGELQNDGDLVIYTHTLTLSGDIIVGLKSRTIDLHLYSGVVDIQGIVEKEYNDIFIVEVQNISGSLVDTGIVDDMLDGGSGIYIAQAGIYLPVEFSMKYILLNKGENGVLKTQNISNNQIVPITYFVCKSSDPNKNCSQLKQNISSSAEKTVSTSRGDKLYKLEGISSRFFTNGNYYGYFINDVSDQEVIDLVNAIVLPTEAYVKDNLLDKMKVLCTDEKLSLMQVQTQSFAMDINGLVVTLQGPTADGSASCKLFIDPSQVAGAIKISYITNTTNPVSDSSDSISSSSSLSDLDTSVKQFPINLEKALTFTSSRGYAIVFPSSNIAYEAVNINDDLGLPSVRCSSQMNVTKFTDKETIHQDPKVSIYTCSIKGTLNNLGNSIIQKESENGTKFLIQIIDPAWMDFATNIQIN